MLLITIYAHYCCSGRICRLILHCGKDPVTLLYINLNLLKACLNLLTAQGPADKSTNTFTQMRASSCARQGFIQHRPLPAAGGAQSLSSHSAQANTIFYSAMKYSNTTELISSIKKYPVSAIYSTIMLYLQRSFCIMITFTYDTWIYFDYTYPFKCWTCDF